LPLAPSGGVAPPIPPLGEACDVSERAPWDAIAAETPPAKNQPARKFAGAELDLEAELASKRREWQRTDDARRVRKQLADRRLVAKTARRAEQRKRALAELAELERTQATIAGQIDPHDVTSLDPSSLTDEERRALLFDGAESDPEPEPEPERVGPAPTPAPRSRARRRQAQALAPRSAPPEPSKARAARARRNADHVSRHRQKFLRRHGGDDAPPTIPRELWIQVQLMAADKRTTEYYLSECPNLALVGAIRNGARAPLGDGTTRYTFADRRARVIAALGLAIWQLGRDTRHLEFSRLTRGVNRCALALLVRDPHGGDPHCKACGNTHPSFSALTGVHRDGGTLSNGQIGWLRALEQAGAIQRYQLRHPAAIARCCQAWELGERGYPCAWYWSLGMLHHPDEFTDAELARFAALRELALQLLDDAAPRRVSFRRATQCNDTLHAATEPRPPP